MLVKWTNLLDIPFYILIPYFDLHTIITMAITSKHFNNSTQKYGHLVHFNKIINSPSQGLALKSKFKNVKFIILVSHNFTDIDLINLDPLNIVSLYVGTNIGISNNSINKMLNLTSIDLSSNNRITFDAINTPKLKSLNLFNNITFTIPNNPLPNLTNITQLILKRNNNITDKILQQFRNLKVLSLEWNDTITNNGISHLYDTLEKLDLSSNSQITDNCLCKFKKLKSLYLAQNKLITNKTLSHLTELTGLNINLNYNITLKGIIPDNIKHLDLGFNYIITDNDLLGFPNLVSLILYANNVVSDDCLSKMVSLKYLNLSMNSHITNKGLMTLTNLVSLNVSYNNNITADILPFLKSLQKINIVSCRHISISDVVGRYTMLTTYDYDFEFEFDI